MLREEADLGRVLWGLCGGRDEGCDEGGGGGGAAGGGDGGLEGSGGLMHGCIY